ncbi:hypothetical protein CDD80_7192 [Ophiocordyceps camponoti-rufipedis]|uniref:Oxidoreductase-like domain-containing protein n=1 Tax=Ophiocordyceps camponoti-rufipedis TaxID=2004952 RepID=A0A2C5YJH5_9HYPO|nr:hypothetical protein CDD80_7192 [Ophiocordyceps camponoti-rufipedis]
MTTRTTAHLLHLLAPPQRRLFTALAWPQHCPLGPYYDILLRHPTPYKPEPRTPQPDKTPDPDDRLSTPPRKKKPGRKKPPTSESAPAERARIIFGSRLLGPAEEADRAASKRAQSTTVAGVTVPPRPREPDNCCMSGCVNCVWDRYRDDMEEWSARNREAQVRLAGASLDVRLGDAKVGKDGWDEEAFADVPVGIREFMKHEKRLKESRQVGAA